MKLSKTLIGALLAQVLFSQLALAQATVQNQDLNAEVDSEIENMYQPPAQNSNTTNQLKSRGGVITQTVVIPAQQQQQAVQKQPETQIESSPLSNSRADSIRRGRQDEELKTESRIVEKLEQSRLEDEKKRAQVLFGDKFDSLQQQQQQQPARVEPVQQAAPPIAPAPPAQPIIINQNETLTRDAVREEVRAALSEDEKAIVPSLDQRYFTLNAGVGIYPDVSAIKGNYSLGAGFGNRYDYFLVEGTFTYSNYSVTANYYDQYYNVRRNGNFDLNQYQGSIATKYQLLGGFVRPTVGGLISYSYRQYTANDLGSTYSNGSEVGNSHAIDLGLTAGVDLEFNSKMAFGAEMKYNFNLANRLSKPSVAGSTSVEKLQYFTAGVFGRVNF